MKIYLTLSLMFLFIFFQPEVLPGVPSLQSICATSIAQNIDKDELIAGVIAGDANTLKFLSDVCLTDESSCAFVDGLLPNFFVANKIFEEDGGFAVLSLAWSPDCKYLASGASCRQFESPAIRRAVGIMNVATGERKVLAVPGGWVNSVAWSQDGRYLAAGLNDRVAKVWDAQSEQPCCILDGFMDSVNSFAWTSGNKLIGGGADGMVMERDLASGKNRVFGCHQAGVCSVACSLDGKYLASCSSDGITVIWDLTSGKCIRSIYGHGHSKNSVAWSFDSRYLASGSNDRTVRVWDVKEARECALFKGHKSLVSSVGWSPDGKCIVSGSDDATVMIWNVGDRVRERVLAGHKSYVSSVAWSLDGKYIASASWDGTIRLWRKITDLNQVILVLILKYLEKQNRLSDFYDVITLPCLNKKNGLIRLVPAWFAFNPIEQNFLNTAFCTRCPAKSLRRISNFKN